MGVSGTTLEDSNGNSLCVMTHLDAVGREGISGSDGDGVIR